jgi:hypothetical protein
VLLVAGLSVWTLVGMIVVGVLLTVPFVYFGARALEKREPYRSFLHLRTRSKVRFFRLLAGDVRVPRRVKALPFLLLPYLLHCRGRV